jgi:hypothetical protein
MKNLLIILLSLPITSFGQNESRNGWSNYENTECMKIFQPFKAFAEKYSMDGDVMVKCMCNEAEASYASYYEFKKITMTEELAQKLFSPCAPKVPDYTNDKCVEGDCINGYGKFYFSEGNYYEGNFNNGVMHGKGKLVLNGVEGTGKFRDGLRHGKFILLDLKTGIKNKITFKDDVIQ